MNHVREQAVRVVRRVRRTSRRARTRLVNAPGRTNAEAVAYSGATWHAATAAQRYALPPAQQIGPAPIDLGAMLADTLPAAGVLELPGGAVFGRNSWIYDNQDHVVTELSWYGLHGDEARQREVLPRHLTAPQPLRGSCLVIATTWGWNYGHFLLDALPRLAVARAARMEPARFDHVIVPAVPDSATARRLVERAGLTGAQVHEAAEGTNFRADRLFVPSFPGARRQYASIVPEYLRSIGTAPVRSGRKLFLSRRGYGRNPIESNQLEALAIEAGYELYDPMTSEDQTRDFAEADCVVGVTGSALANLAFCRPGTTVVEVFSDAHPYPYYFTLSGAAGLRYGYVVGRSGDAVRSFGASNADFHLAPEVFGAALTWAGQ